MIDLILLCVIGIRLNAPIWYYALISLSCLSKAVEYKNIKDLAEATKILILHKEISRIGRH